MRRVLHHFTFGAALLLLSTSAAHALGLGTGVMSSTLGQPLDFSAQLAADADDAPMRECVAAEVRVGDARLPPEHVLATVENGRQAGERRIRVTTRSAIDEPVVTVDVTIGCTSRVSRRFVEFVDPPTLRLAHAQPSGFVPQRVASQVAPLVDIVNEVNRRVAAQRVAGADAKSAAGAAPRRGASGRRLAGATVERGAPPAAGVAAPSAGRDEARTRGTVVALRSGPRLRLDAALPVLPLPAAATSTAVAAPDDSKVADAASTAPAAPAIGIDAPADAASAALAVERARIEGLETALARLRGESQAQQQTLGALQARLREAEGERYANGLVYLLALGLAFFAVLAGAFWALRPRQRERARWFEAQARRPQRPAAAPPVEAEAALPRVSQPPSGWNEGPHSILPVTAPAAIGGLEVTTVLAPQSHYARMAREEASANAPLQSAGPTSSPIDDLLDLEQQAEFFAILGQDDAAAALLTSHLRHNGDGSPLPFLHLLEIYRRLGHRGAFERARIDHGANLETFVPAWDAAPETGRSLADHAQTVANLQTLWATPSEAMRMIESLLFRRGDSDAVFDLAGYRDLLFLYSVARDLVGQAQANESAVDLYLPIDDAPTVPLPRDAGGHAVDLDVSGWPDMADEPSVVRRLAGGRAG